MSLISQIFRLWIICNIIICSPSTFHFHLSLCYFSTHSESLASVVHSHSAICFRPLSSKLFVQIVYHTTATPELEIQQVTCTMSMKPPPLPHYLHEKLHTSYAAATGLLPIVDVAVVEVVARASCIRRCSACCWRVPPSSPSTVCWL